MAPEPISDVFTLDLKSQLQTDRSLTLLPGNGMCAEFYAPLGRCLTSRGFSVRLVTLPGYDGTAPLERPGWSALIDVVLPIVRAGLGHRGTLVGHSLGGLLALLIAARLGDALGSLVLMEPAILPWSWLAGAAARFYRHRVVDADPGPFRNRGAGYWRLHAPAHYPAESFAVVERCSRTTDRATERALVDQSSDLYPLPFSEVRAPTLLVRGASSGISQLLGQQLLSRRLNRARCVTIPKAGHWMANEQDSAVAEAIHRFVEDV